MEVLKKKARIRCMRCMTFHNASFENETELYEWSCPNLHEIEKYRIIYIGVTRIEAQSKSVLRRLLVQMGGEE